MPPKQALVTWGQKSVPTIYLLLKSDWLIPLTSNLGRRYPTLLGADTCTREPKDISITGGERSGANVSDSRAVCRQVALAFAESLSRKCKRNDTSSSPTLDILFLFCCRHRIRVWCRDTRGCVCYSHPRDSEGGSKIANFTDFGSGPLHPIT